MSTVVTPSGGVTGFTATSTDLYVNTGTQLVTYTLTGAQVSSFTLPAGFTSADSASQPVVDPSGDIYLSSYYGAAGRQVLARAARCCGRWTRAAATPPACSRWAPARLRVGGQPDPEHVVER